MTDTYELINVVGRRQFPQGPNEDPGIRLGRGFLPGRTFAGGTISYMHVNHVDNDGNITPSVKDSIDPESGRILDEGEIVLVDQRYEPPKVVRKIGQFVLENGQLVYKPERFL